MPTAQVNAADVAAMKEFDGVDGWEYDEYTGRLVNGHFAIEPSRRLDNPPIWNLCLVLPWESVPTSSSNHRTLAGAIEEWRTGNGLSR